jgi:hypothetical protein
LLELGSQVSQPELLASGRYPWLGGYSLADILIASYDHHQEHFEKLRAWLREDGGGRHGGQRWHCGQPVSLAESS